MTGSEFVRKIKNLARIRGVFYNFIPSQGKGSHGTIYYGENATVISNLKRELKKGTYYGLLKQLGLNIKDFQ